MRDGELTEHIIASLRELVAPGIDVHPHSSIMGDLGLDSLTVMNFVMTLEDSLDVSLPMDRIAEVETVADLAEALEAMTAKVAR